MEYEACDQNVKFLDLMSCTFNRSCSIVSRSRIVKHSSSMESKSIVRHNGVPISSCLRYRFPIDAVVSKVVRKVVANSETNVSAIFISCGLFDMGKIANYALLDVLREYIVYLVRCNFRMQF